MHSRLTISQTDPRPMYLQLMEQIRRRIAVGDWQPGEEIPSIRSLAASTSVSVITVKRAYLELEREGVLVTRQGRGTFVARNVDLGTDLRRRELDEHLRAAAEIGRELGLAPDALEARLHEILVESAPQEDGEPNDVGETKAPAEAPTETEDDAARGSASPGGSAAADDRAKTASKGETTQ